ncbi:MAG TPA: FtsX-like permease family protein [Thermoleophilaceae bacterium]
MIRSFEQLPLRQLRTRPLRAALTGMGVALGVAMVFGVLLLVGTIRHTFDDLISSAFGDQQVLVVPKAGTIPDATIDRIRKVPGVGGAAGMIGAAFTRLDAHGKPLSGPTSRLFVAGYGPFGMKPYDFRIVRGHAAVFGPTIILERNWARGRHLDVGSRVRVGTPSGPATLRVVGIFRFSSGLNFGGQGLAGMPLRAARDLMQIPEGLSQITVAADSTAQVEPVKRRLQAALGKGFDVQTPEDTMAEVKKQLRALDTILYFFSGIALFVGGFLILNSFNMTVLQRMRELGMLRTLGASRRMVSQTVLLEAFVIGIAGATIGLGVGIGLAAGLVSLMQSLGVPVGTLQLAPAAAIEAFVLGVVVALAGAFWPARRATRIAPVRAAMGNVTVRARLGVRRALAGFTLFVPGALLGGELWFGSNSGSGTDALLGMTVTIAMFVGMVLAAPFVVLPLVRALAWPLRRMSPAGGRLAADSLRSNGARTAATAAALMVGLSVVVVNSSMSSSFLGTIRTQIDRNFARDFNVQAHGFTLEEGGGPGVPETMVARLRRLPEAAAVVPVKALYVGKLPGTSRPGLVTAFDPKTYGQVDKTPVKDVPRNHALAAMAHDGVLVGALYADAVKLHRGSYLRLTGANGSRRVRVVGVLQSIGEFVGFSMQMSDATLRAVYGRTTTAQVAVKARSDRARAALQRKVAAIIRADYPNLELQSASAKKAEVNKQINTQFNLFNGIVAIAVIVSILGVVNTLAMSVMERTREIGVMRALGSSRWQIRQTMLDESLLVTLAGAASGLGFGLVVGWLWVKSLDVLVPGIGFYLPVAAILAVAVAAVIAGVLASILPARRAARLNIIEALTYE